MQQLEQAKTVLVATALLLGVAASTMCSKDAVGSMMWNPSKNVAMNWDN